MSFLTAVKKLHGIRQDVSLRGQQMVFLMGRDRDVS